MFNLFKSPPIHADVEVKPKVEGIFKTINMSGTAYYWARFDNDMCYRFSSALNRSAFLDAYEYNMTDINSGMSGTRWEEIVRDESRGYHEIVIRL